MSESDAKACKPERIVGLDVARTMAICGMSLIHFSMVLSGQVPDSVFGGWFVNRLSGRPAMIFMLLAGIGVSLRLAGGQDESRVGRVRRDLRNRGLFFLVFGFAFLAVWSGDILRVYGVGYLLATLLIARRDRVLWLSSAVLFTGMIGLLFVIDFETNWDFDTLEYANLWTVSGGLMNLFYNGFRAVFPWCGLLVIGMLIGRRDLRDGQVRRCLFILGLLMWSITEVVSYQLLEWLLPLADPSEHEIVVAIFGTDSLPAMPLFLLSSTGFALVVITTCVHFQELRMLRPVAAAGRMAFTWYITHALVVLGAGVATNFQTDTSQGMMYLTTAIFCGVMILSSWLYQRKFRLGPLEWLMRKIT